MIPIFLMMALAPFLPMLAVGLIAGLTTDLLYRVWDLFIDHGWKRRAFFMLLPVLLSGSYFVVLEIMFDVVWYVE
jgi:hypothetical protein